MRSLSHYASTVSHLKFRQITYQLIRLFFHQTKALLVTGNVTRRQGVVMGRPLLRHMHGEEDTFTFLNVTKIFDPARFDWSSLDVGKLWRYNLHYFDYLHEEERSWQSKAFLIDSWIKNNPQGTPDAWEPFPLSLRIVNWIKLFLTQEIKRKLEERWLKSLYEQTLWLERNIEYHLLANHYFKNGKALIFAGLFFAGEDAERWLKKGLAVIRDELDEQILADGGHFERSPMYHSMILEDCLDLLNIMNECGKIEITGVLRKLAAATGKMSCFLAAMCHLDDGIALFNDAAFGIEAAPADLIDYYERLTGRSLLEPEDRCISLPASGYFIMAPTRGDRLFIDCGLMGPDYQPGHAHCDTLSIELSLKGKRIIIDSGCYGYEDGPMREYNRGNAGHNTVMIDGQNQSEVWASHRCAHRAKPLYARLNDVDNALVFEGAHNGYQRLHGKPVHHRKIIWQAGRIVIADIIDGKGVHDIELRLHINPDLKISAAGGKVTIRDGEATITSILSFPDECGTVKQGWYCPEFGKKIPCDVLVKEYRKVRLPLKTRWTILIS